jgi:CyaY protein
MERRRFVPLANGALEHIEGILGDLELDELDVELAGDVLTLEFADGTQFVINAHSAALQVWMAAGSTAWHFDWDDEKAAWHAKKTGDELMATTSRVVGEKLGRAIQL